VRASGGPVGQRWRACPVGPGPHGRRRLGTGVRRLESRGLGFLTACREHEQVPSDVSRDLLPGLPGVLFILRSVGVVCRLGLLVVGLVRFPMALVEGLRENPTGNTIVAELNTEKVRYMVGGRGVWSVQPLAFLASMRLQNKSRVRGVCFCRCSQDEDLDLL
jgi:hypothetical protein